MSDAGRDRLGRHDDPPSERERADARHNRARILAAAREVIGRLGPEASIASVAAAAGVGIGTVYRKYPTKRELFAAITSESRAELTALMTAAEVSPRPEDTLSDVIATAVRILRRDRALAEALGERLGADFGCDQIQNELCRLAVDLVRHGQALGHFRRDVRPETYGALMRGLAAAALSPDLKGLSDDEAARSLVQTLVGTLRSGS